MNNILFSISIIILFYAIILLTIYITKSTFKCIKINTEDIYTIRPSEIFKKMFSQPSVWTGYQDYDPNDKIEKIYIKNI